MADCDHMAVGFIGGKATVVRLAALNLVLKTCEQLYWVSNEPAPKEFVAKYAKEFTRFGYCPKCGEKLDFEEALKGVI